MGAIVKIPLQAARRSILGLHQPLARGSKLRGLGRDLVEPSLELGGELDVPKRRSSLVGEVGQQLILVLTERLSRPLRHPQVTHWPALVVHGDRAVVGTVRRSLRPGRGPDAVLRQEDLDLAPLRAHPPGPGLGHLRQDLVNGQGPGEAAREVRERLVGRCPTPVHQHIRQALQAPSERLERQRHNGGGEDR